MGEIPKRIGDVYMRAWIEAKMEPPSDKIAYACYRTHIEEVYYTTTILVLTRASSLRLCSRKHESLCGVKLERDTRYNISGYVDKDTLYTSLCDYYHDQISN